MKNPDQEPHSKLAEDVAVLRMQTYRNESVILALDNEATSLEMHPPLPKTKAPRIPLGNGGYKVENCPTTG